GTTTVNLTTEVEDTNARSRFSIYRGMRLPAGLKYYGSPGCGLTDQNSSSSSPRNWRVLDDDVVANCGTRVNAYISYFPATFYLPENHPAPSGFHEGNRVLAQNA